MGHQLSVIRLGERIKAQRGKRTQGEIEHLTGIKRAVLGRIESGKYIPSVLQLNKLVDVLEIDISEILEGKEQSVFVSMMREARTPTEKEGFEQMISMMLCLRKYEKLKDITQGL